VNTIVFFGNSLIEGRYGGDVVAVTAAHLPGVQVINAGQAGNTIHRRATPSIICWSAWKLM